ncbi:unnamed protein product [Cylindrotheca closterium]|uniref:Uncharacterized protein n=1 Tax=Cylindrotheca closterium TaxID=2856 RepID=A0AAD2FQS6_9STRA|nr:unnamed protein product [Cylindrotheca closterium]
MESRRPLRTRDNVFLFKGDQTEDEIPGNLTDIDVHESLQEIPPRVFEGFRFLVDIRLPQGLRVIGPSAFEECVSLEYLSVPSSVEAIGESAFGSCTRLREVELFEGLKIISKNSFYCCEVLQSMSVPSSVNIIGSSAFQSCSSLTDLKLRVGLERIGGHAFANCDSLKEMTVPSTVVSLGENVFDNCILLQKLILACRLTDTGEGMASECKALSEVKFPSTLRTINREAFAECTHLCNIGLPEGLQLIDDEAFLFCFLKEVALPSTMRIIGVQAFANCSFLREVNFGEGLKVISDRAFCGCASLKGISLPSSIEQIREFAFVHCWNLLGVEFQHGKTAFLAPGVFSGCSALVTISIPSSVTINSEDDIFDGCNSLIGNEDSADASAVLQRLTDRFAHHPIHNACYRSSFSELPALLKSKSKYDLVDCYGMTPLHIAVTTAKLQKNILRCLLDAYNYEVVCRRDDSGRTMIDYLFTNSSREATDSIEMILDTCILCPSSGWGLTDWRTAIHAAVDQSFSDEEGYELAEFIDMEGIFARNTKMEISSVLELALWGKSIKYFDRGDKRQKVDRENNRLMCGADIVIPNVLEFFGDIPTLTTCTV